MSRKGTYNYMAPEVYKGEKYGAACDGMGGETAGERASLAACRELSEASKLLTAEPIGNKKLVTDSILKANDRLCEIMQNEQSGRMGSTVVAALIQGDHLYYTNLGDSRLYLARGEGISQLTKDHTEGQAMVDAGVLTKEQLKSHPSRNKLNRHLGILSEEMRLECPVYGEIALLPGDRLLLVSDGVFGSLDDMDMTAILFSSLSPEAKAERLVDLAFEKGSRDNMTAVVIEIEAALGKSLPRISAGADVRGSTPRPADEPRRKFPVGAIIAIIAAASLLLVFSLIGGAALLGDDPDTTHEPANIVSESPDSSAVPVLSDSPTKAPSEEPTEKAAEAPTAAPTEASTEAAESDVPEPSGSAEPEGSGTP